MAPEQTGEKYKKAKATLAHPSDMRRSRQRRGGQFASRVTWPKGMSWSTPEWTGLCGDTQGVIVVVFRLTPG